jgi:hypothetical protein
VEVFYLLYIWIYEVLSYFTFGKRYGLHVEISVCCAISLILLHCHNLLNQLEFSIFRLIFCPLTVEIGELEGHSDVFGC